MVSLCNSLKFYRRRWGEGQTRGLTDYTCAVILWSGPSVYVVSCMASVVAVAIGATSFFATYSSWACDRGQMPLCPKLGAL